MVSLPSSPLPPPSHACYAWNLLLFFLSGLRSSRTGGIILPLSSRRGSDGGSTLVLPSAGSASGGAASGLDDDGEPMYDAVGNPLRAVDELVWPWYFFLFFYIFFFFAKIFFTEIFGRADVRRRGRPAAYCA